MVEIPCHHMNSKRSHLIRSRRGQLSAPPEAEPLFIKNHKTGVSVHAYSHAQRNVWAYSLLSVSGKSARVYYML